MFLNNKTYLCIVDYHRKFTVMKLTDVLNSDSLIKICKIIFAEASKKNYVWCWYKFCFKEVLGILQASEYS